MQPRNRLRAATAISLPILIFAVCAAHAQARPDAAFFRDAKVANFAVQGEAFPSPKFERLALWADAGGKTYVVYGYGSRDTEVVLQAAGRSADGGAFALRFPNGHVLDVAPRGDALQVTDRKGRYDKRFAWQYEGPVDGRGTFCAQCVEEKGAAAFVRDRFLK